MGVSPSKNLTQQSDIALVQEKFGVLAR
ncbi:protein of unknown function [Magnetospirillum sp. XM-1]|nr:protein of unknown function [Magnetospirillum sp. XM-1]CUW40027.1 protein of unknown function [Magnetospirillum sp. XM-1]